MEIYYNYTKLIVMMRMGVTVLTICGTSLVKLYYYVCVLLCGRAVYMLSR